MKSGAEWLWVVPIRTCASLSPVMAATCLRTSRVIWLPMPGQVDDAHDQAAAVALDGEGAGEDRVVHALGRPAGVGRAVGTHVDVVAGDDGRVGETSCDVHAEQEVLERGGSPVVVASVVVASSVVVPGSSVVGPGPEVVGPGPVVWPPSAPPLLLSVAVPGPMPEPVVGASLVSVPAPLLPGVPVLEPVESVAGSPQAASANRRRLG
jgi:hypothetical protein